MALSVDIGFNDSSVSKQFRSYDDIYYAELQKQPISPTDFGALRKQYTSTSSTSSSSADDNSPRYIFYDDTDVDRLSPMFRRLYALDDDYFVSKNKGSNDIAEGNFSEGLSHEKIDDDDPYNDGAYGVYFNEATDNYTRQEVEEMKRKIDVWIESVRADNDITGLFDTSEAFLLELDGAQIAETDYDLYFYLFHLSRDCRLKVSKCDFTNPGEPLCEGGIISYDGDQLEKSYIDFTFCAREAIKRFNDCIKKRKLEFVSVCKATMRSGSLMYLTLTALDLETRTIGTYHAALVIDIDIEYPAGVPVGPQTRGHFYVKEAHLVFLRHVEANKVLFLLTITEAEE